MDKTELVTKIKAMDQIELVANWIMANIPQEIGDEGAGDVAVRVMGQMMLAIETAKKEIGVPVSGYPANIATAYAVLDNAIAPPIGG